MAGYENFYFIANLFISVSCSPQRSAWDWELVSDGEINHDLDNTMNADVGQELDEDSDIQ